MTFKHILPFFLFFIVSVYSCSGESSPSPNIDKSILSDDLAIYYYNLKFSGKYKECIENMNSCDSLTDKYKRRMHDILSHHTKDIFQSKRGIDSLYVTRKQFNLKGDVAYVFFNVRYKDATWEEILLPFVRIDREWHLR